MPRGISSDMPCYGVYTIPVEIGTAYQNQPNVSLQKLVSTLNTTKIIGIKNKKLHTNTSKMFQINFGAKLFLTQL